MEQAYFQEPKIYVNNNISKITLEALSRGEMHAYGIENYSLRKYGTRPSHSSLVKKIRKLEEEGFIFHSRDLAGRGRTRRMYKLVPMVEEILKVGTKKMADQPLEIKASTSKAVLPRIYNTS